MYLLIAVINDEELLEEIITGWLDIGITGATVAETTDLLQLISRYIPIFAGFRSLTTGGMRQNKMLFVAVKEREILDQAVEYLEMICRNTGKPHQGVYFVAPLLAFESLGLEVHPEQQQRHIEKKVGRPLEEIVKKDTV